MPRISVLPKQLRYTWKRVTLKDMPRKSQYIPLILRGQPNLSSPIYQWWKYVVRTSGGTQLRSSSMLFERRHSRDWKRINIISLAVIKSRNTVKRWRYIHFWTSPPIDLNQSSSLWNKVSILFFVNCAPFEIFHLPISHFNRCQSVMSSVM